MILKVTTVAKKFQRNSPLLYIYILYIYIYNYIYMEVSINGGVPQKRWMVYFMENPI